MGEYVGDIGPYEVWWDSESGAVYVGNERCHDEAVSADHAMEIAEDYIQNFMSTEGYE